MIIFKLAVCWLCCFAVMVKFSWQMYALFVPTRVFFFFFAEGLLILLMTAVIIKRVIICNSKLCNEFLSFLGELRNNRCFSYILQSQSLFCV